MEPSPRATEDASAELDLVALRLAEGGLPALAPAPRWRDWMNATHERWANRCLPLLVANESGWVLLNRYAFEATWSGGDDSASLVVEFDEHVPPPRPESHFGYGIVTWTVPYLFRTPPGFNLLVRGPANWPKDGACALEGVVETDWSVATFTMNWKLTRPGHGVRFEADEPFCMIVPQRRGELRRFQPELRDIRSDADAWAGAERYADERHALAVEKFLGRYARDYESSVLAWEADYFKGKRPDGAAAVEHETQLRLSGFVERDVTGGDAA